MIRLPAAKLGPVVFGEHVPSLHVAEQHSDGASHASPFCFSVQPAVDDAASGTIAVCDSPQAATRNAMRHARVANMVAPWLWGGRMLATHVVGIAAVRIAIEVACKQRTRGVLATTPQLDASGGVQRGFSGG